MRPRYGNNGGMTGPPSTRVRTLSLALIVAAVGLTIFHVATDAGDGQEAASWISWTAAVLGFAAAGVALLHRRQAKAPGPSDRRR